MNPILALFRIAIAALSVIAITSLMFRGAAAGDMRLSRIRGFSTARFELPEGVATVSSLSDLASKQLHHCSIKAQNELSSNIIEFQNKPLSMLDLTGVIGQTLECGVMRIERNVVFGKEIEPLIRKYLVADELLVYYGKTTVVDDSGDETDGFFAKFFFDPFEIREIIISEVSFLVNQRSFPASDWGFDGSDGGEVVALPPSHFGDKGKDHRLIIKASVMRVHDLVLAEVEKQGAGLFRSELLSVNLGPIRREPGASSMPFHRSVRLEFHERLKPGFRQLLSVDLAKNNTFIKNFRYSVNVSEDRTVIEVNAPIAYLEDARLSLVTGRVLPEERQISIPLE